MHRGAQGGQIALALHHYSQQKVEDREAGNQKVQPIPAPAHAASRNQIILCQEKHIPKNPAAAAQKARLPPWKSAPPGPSPKSISRLTRSISRTSPCSSSS